MGVIGLPSRPPPAPKPRGANGEPGVGEKSMADILDWRMYIIQVWSLFCFVFLYV
jgi:hypothetical protein